MNTSTLYIKNMVCPRCIMAVENILSTEKLHLKEIKLGKVELAEEISSDRVELLDGKLKKMGFEILKSHEQKLIESVKTNLLELIERADEKAANTKLSVLLSEKTNTDYTQLSKLFSRVEGITIEKYFISLKIEKVKELISYGDLTLSEIAFRLFYSSVQHLSNQFKAVTGMNVSEFKKLSDHNRKPLTHLH